MRCKHCNAEIARHRAGALNPHASDYYVWVHQSSGHANCRAETTAEPPELTDVLDRAISELNGDFREVSRDTAVELIAEVERLREIVEAAAEPEVQP